MPLMRKSTFQKASNRTLIGGRTFATDERIEELNDQVAAGLNYRMNQKMDIVEAHPVDYVVRGPWDEWRLYLSYDSTPEEIEHDRIYMEILGSDIRAAADLALRYRMTGDILLAMKVAEIIAAWSTPIPIFNNSASLLPWSDHWSVLIQAALMVKDSQPYTAKIHSEFQARTAEMFRILGIPNGHDGGPSTARNNWSSVGTQAKMAVATLLEDRVMLDGAIYRWRQVFNDSVVSNFLGVDGEYHDNVQQYEVYRQAGGFGDGSSGLLYCNYDFSAKMCGAEWARINGEWLFDHVSPDGSSLRGLFDVIVELNRYPDPEHHWFNTSNPPNRFYSNQIYAGYDVAHALWGVGNPDSEWIIENQGLGPTAGATGIWVETDIDFIRNTELLYRGKELI